MTTRNLYEVQDVSAAVLFAMASHDVKLLHATVQELIGSGCEQQARSLLILGWLLATPVPKSSKACYLAFTSPTLHDLLDAATHLPPYELPNVANPTPPPPSDLPTAYTSTWSFLPKSWTKAAKARFEQALTYALKTNNHTHASYLTRALPIDNTVSLLQALGIKKEYTTMFETKDLHHRLIDHAYAILAFADTPVYKLLPVKPTTGRCFTIPSLVYATWSVNPQPTSRLVGLPYQILEPAATPFWHSVVKEFQIRRQEDELIFLDDETLERFYATYFPNDIPDEWSAEERRKSHPFPKINLLENPWIPAFLRLC